MAYKGGKGGGKAPGGKAPGGNFTPNVDGMPSSCIDHLPKAGVAVFRESTELAVDFCEKLREAMAEYESGQVFFENIDISQVQWNVLNFSVFLEVLQEKEAVTKRLKVFKAGLDDDCVRLLAGWIEQLPPEGLPSEIHLSHNQSTQDGFELLVNALEGKRVELEEQAPPVWLRMESNSVDLSEDGPVVKPLVEAGRLELLGKVGDRRPSPAVVAIPQLRQSSSGGWSSSSASAGMAALPSTSSSSGKGKGKGSSWSSSSWDSKSSSGQSWDRDSWNRDGNWDKSKSDNSGSSWWKKDSDKSDKWWEKKNDKSWDEGDWKKDKGSSWSGSSWQDAKKPADKDDWKQDTPWRRDDRSKQTQSTHTNGAAANSSQATKPTTSAERTSAIGRSRQAGSAADRSRTPPPRKEPDEEKLPPGWEKQWSDEYSIPYFWNKVTGESLWEPPKA
mmetsp:Transcript_76662/g.173393  ORF Transcript_76662/g.173393 Transcript_76662/m.173393 type:complete len:445 (+) Transcript_76662:139-1473(+)